MSAVEAERSGDGKPAARKWLTAAAIGAGWILILVGTLAVVGRLPDAEAWAQLDAARFLGAAMFFVPIFGASIALRGLRWWDMMRQEIALPLLRTVLLYAWIFSVKAFTPMRSGEFLRALWVKKHGGSAGFATGTILLERVIDLLVILALTAVALIFSRSNPFSDRVMFFAVAVSLAPLVALPVIGIIRRYTGGFGGPSDAGGPAAVLRRVLQACDKFLSAFQLMGNWRRLISFLVVSMVAWVFIAGAYHVYLTQFFPETPLYTSLAMILLVNFVSLISASPGSIGSFEAAGVVVLAAVGIGIEQALPVVIGLHVLILLSSLVWGLAARVALRREIGGAVRLY